MSILIDGLQLPSHGYYTVKIFSDGTVVVPISKSSVEARFYDAIPVPPHGDLIDRDVLLEDKTDMLVGKMMVFGGQYVYSEDAIKNAPTVIPASREDSK